MIDAGACFIIPRVTGEIDHLIIVITDWDPHCECVLVNMTDFENHLDPAIDIPPNTQLTQSFTTTKRSTINYQQARRVSAQAMATLVVKQSVDGCGICATDWLAQIRAQLFASPGTPIPVLEYCEPFDWGL